MGKLVANVDDDVKARAAALYDSMGMSLSTAVNMFLRQSLVDNGLPFRPTRHTPDGYPVPPVHNAYMCVLASWRPLCERCFSAV